MMCVVINAGAAGVNLWSALGRTTALPLAQLGVVLTACLMLERARAQLAFSSSSFSWFPLAETGVEGIVVQELKFLTHTAVPRLHWALCCSTVADTCESLRVAWKNKSRENNNKNLYKSLRSAMLYFQ